MASQSVPAALKVLNGDKRERINVDEPVPADRMPTAPAWMTLAQRQLFRSTCRELKAMGLLFTADLDNLVNYVVAADLAYRLAIEVNGLEEFTCYNTAQGLKAHPLLAALDKAHNRVALLARSFGLTPVARQAIRMSVTRPDTEAAAETPGSYFRSA